MAAPQKGNSQLADASDNPLLGNQQANIADPASTLTATLGASGAQAITLTYTTDDPLTTPNGLVTIADGDATVVADEIWEAADEFESSINALITLTNELITDHATFITDITQNRAAINSILDVLEEHGLMVAT